MNKTRYLPSTTPAIWILCLAAVIMPVVSASGQGVLDQAKSLRKEGLALAQEAYKTKDPETSEHALFVLYEALDLYQEYFVAYPDKESRHERALVEINSTIYWLRKFTIIDVKALDRSVKKKRKNNWNRKRPLQITQRTAQRPKDVVPTFERTEHQIRYLLQKRRMVEADLKFQALDQANPDSKERLEVLAMEIEMVGELQGLAFESADKHLGQSMTFQMLDKTILKGRVEKVGLDVLYINTQQVTFPARISMMSPPSVIHLVELLKTPAAYLCTAVYRSILNDPEGCLDNIYKAKRMGSIRAHEVMLKLQKTGRLRMINTSIKTEM